MTNLNVHLQGTSRTYHFVTPVLRVARLQDVLFGQYCNTFWPLLVYRAVCIWHVLLNMLEITSWCTCACAWQCTFSCAFNGKSKCTFCCKFCTPVLPLNCFCMLFVVLFHVLFGVQHEALCSSSCVVRLRYVISLPGVLLVLHQVLLFSVQLALSLNAPYCQCCCTLRCTFRTIL